MAALNTILTHSSEASSLVPDDTPPRIPRPFSAPASETAYGLRENPKKTRRAANYLNLESLVN
ncbi:hypothetical protein QJS04_geneDACA009632 [Acorus gramineus]|uniref:Uncharacterized protein n=1 Tax=Acorus gramineus TaxID=55184 RepID=A0AAV9B920_ACOGR|nr:hypothetical protein QJS04_geneDACA009632 [Acorus gramineus]